MTRFVRIWAMMGAASLIAGSGCGDLEITNPNNPDIARAVGSADQAKNLAISTINSWYVTSTNRQPYTAASVTADVYTTNFCCGRFNNLEPRTPYENLSAGGDRD